MTDIVIIGGGAAGAAVFVALLRQGSYGRTVHWVAGHDAAGRGVAYSTTDERHLLNVRASGMGLHADREGDFVDYASRQRPNVHATDFLPRCLFGDYVTDQLQTHIEAARKIQRPFSIHAAEVVGIEPGDGGYRVLLDDGQTLQAGSVVLAVGALSPRPLRTVSANALASGAYELDPWSLVRRSAVPRRVLVIGTGLTAVDTLLAAARRWPGAELVAVSRHGLLPFVHPPFPLGPYPGQAKLNAALLASRGVRSMLRCFRDTLRTTPQVDWRTLVDGMRPVNARLWQKLTLAQRKQFLHHLRWLWEASRHRTAPQTAQAIEQLRDEGRLQVHAARVLGVDGTGPLDVTLRSRASQVMTTLRADLVVQATGLDTAVAYTQHPLLSQLLRDGLATADPLQLGVAAQPDGRLFDAHGTVQPGLYAIGSLLRGNLWECTAMPEIRVAAQALAACLAEGPEPPASGTAGTDPLPADSHADAPTTIRHNDMAIGGFARV